MRVDEMHLFANEEPEATIQHSDFWYLVGKSGFVVWSRESKEMKSFPYHAIRVFGRSTNIYDMSGRINVLTIRDLDGVIVEEIEEREHDDFMRFSEVLHRRMVEA